VVTEFSVKMTPVEIVYSLTRYVICGRLKSCSFSRLGKQITKTDFLSISRVEGVGTLKVLIKLACVVG
jgi:hypothetical protein